MVDGISRETSRNQLATFHGTPQASCTPSPLLPPSPPLYCPTSPFGGGSKWGLNKWGRSNFQNVPGNIQNCSEITEIFAFLFTIFVFFQLSVFLRHFEKSLKHESAFRSVYIAKRNVHRAESVLMIQRLCSNFSTGNGKRKDSC